MDIGVGEAVAMHGEGGRPAGGQHERHGDQHRRNDARGRRRAPPAGARGGRLAAALAPAEPRQRRARQPPGAEAHEQAQHQVEGDVEHRGQRLLVGVRKGVGRVARKVGDQGDDGPGGDEQRRREPEERPAPHEEHDEPDQRERKDGRQPLMDQQRGRGAELGERGAHAGVAARQVLVPRDDPPEVRPGSGVAPVHERPPGSRHGQVEVGQQPRQVEARADGELPPRRPQPALEGKAVQGDRRQQHDEGVVRGEPEPQHEADGVEQASPPARRGRACPDEREQQEQGDEGCVQPVDLGDDGLRPRGRRGRREQAGAEAGGTDEQARRAGERRRPGRAVAARRRGAAPGAGDTRAATLVDQQHGRPRDEPGRHGRKDGRHEVHPQRHRAERQEGEEVGDDRPQRVAGFVRHTQGVGRRDQLAGVLEGDCGSEGRHVERQGQHERQGDRAAQQPAARAARGRGSVVGHDRGRHGGFGGRGGRLARRDGVATGRRTAAR